MIDLPPAPVPDLSDDWLASHREALVDALSQRRRRPVRWVTLAGATGVAATVSSLLLLGGSTTNAFAGWSAAPTAPASGQLTTADTSCQADQAQAVQFFPPDEGPVPDIATFVPELSDVRGPYTLTLLGNGGPGAILCISSSTSTVLRWIAGSGTPVGPGTIALDQVSSLTRDSQPYTLVEGRTGTGVSAVTLILGDGTQVTATSGHGLFLAWWPGSQNITSAIVATPTGVSTQTLNLPESQVPNSPKTPPYLPGVQTSCVPSATVACANQS
jgi:hypothetical protein